MAAPSTSETPAPGRSPMRLLIPLLLLVLVIVAVVVGIRWKRQADMSGPVRASGTIEMDETDVASLVGGRIVRLMVDEGDSVRVGDTLVVLVQGEISAQVRSQQAQLDRSAAQARAVVTGPRSQEVQMARADLEGLKAQSQLADSDFQRGQQLFKSQVIAQAELDRLRSVRDATVAKQNAQADKLRLLELGSRREDVTAAHEATAAARAGLDAARSRQNELVLLAPCSGVVLLKNFEVGELVSAGQPVITLGDPERLWMRVYVAAPRITDVVRGARADVQLSHDSPLRFTGTVSTIASEAEFTPRAALTEEERANLVFGVKIDLDPSGGRLKAGLPADAFIQLAAGHP